MENKNTLFRFITMRAPEVSVSEIAKQQNPKINTEETMENVETMLEIIIGQFESQLVDIQ